MRECYIDARSNSIADLFHSPDHNVWIITRINVPKKERGHGYGSSLLKEILTDADREGAVLGLVISASDGLTNKQLYQWYSRHGFYTDEYPTWWVDSPASLNSMRKYIMRRIPRRVIAPQTEVIFQADEIEFIRRNTNRCSECGHLWLLHRASEDIFLTCRIEPCNCQVRKSESDGEFY